MFKKSKFLGAFCLSIIRNCDHGDVLWKATCLLTIETRVFFIDSSLGDNQQNWWSALKATFHVLHCTL